MLAEGELATRAVPAAEAYGYPLLLKQILAAAVRQAPRQEIVYRDKVRFDYLELSRRVARLGSCLQGIGVKPGTAVGVVDYDSHRYLETYFAVPSIGAALHTVNTRFTPDQLVYTINHARDEVLLVHKDFLPLLEPIWDRLETVSTVILLTDDDTPPDTPFTFQGEYEELLAKADPDFAFPDFDENTIATLFYTTGTTGLPKGVFFSHRQLFMHTLSVGVAFGTSPVQGRLHRADVYMPITPMFHVHGWGIPYIAALLGIKQVYPGRYEPEMLVKLIREEGVTFSHCVPTVAHMLLQATEDKEGALAGLKLAIAGSALPPALAKAARARGIDIFLGYGMSETCPVLTLALIDPDDAPEDDPDQIGRRTSAGKPLALVEVKFERHQDQPESGQEAGEIVVRAPWLTQGYLDSPEASAALWRGGYLHTGDIGYFDESGFLHVTDRAIDVIKCGGEWISSIEVEAALSTLTGVTEVAVIPIQDGKWGERPLALVVVPQGTAEPPEKKAFGSHLKDFIARGKLPRNAILTTFEIVEQLPKTSVGKLDKKLMKSASR